MDLRSLFLGFMFQHLWRGILVARVHLAKAGDSIRKVDMVDPRYVVGYVSYFLEVESNRLTSSDIGHIICGV